MFDQSVLVFNNIFYINFTIFSSNKLADYLSIVKYNPKYKLWNNITN